MKCQACGYEHETQWDAKNRYDETIKGKDPFIIVEGTFLVESKNYYGPSTTRKVNLYACPECKTIKLHDSF